MKCLQIKCLIFNLFVSPFSQFADESGQLGFSQFLSWIQTEPLPLAWLAVMHRIMASENTQHDVRCAVCKGGPPISGFR